MSIKIMKLVFAMQGVTSSMKLVLLSLADHANDDGHSIYPSIDTTAQRTGLTSRGVRKIVKELVKDGFLIPVVKSHGYHTNEYRIDAQRLSQFAAHVENTNHELYSAYSETNPELGSLNHELSSLISAKNPGLGSTDPEPHSVDFEQNPEPSSLISELNPELRSLNPEPRSINPERSSAESSLIIKNLKDMDAKNASAKPQTHKNQDHLPFRNALIAFFIEQTGILGPPRDFKAANRLWITPIYRIGELVDFDIPRGESLVDLALQRLKGLTVSNPNSILKTAQAIAGELKVNHTARQFREEVY